MIKNNDSIEKILKKYDIKNEDIKNISLKLKEKKLSNIYSGRELSLIYKKLEDRIGNNPYLYAISDKEAFDIDWADDFDIAEVLWSKYGKI